MLDDFKRGLLQDLLRDALRGVRSGDTVYGGPQDQTDADEAITEMLTELQTKGSLGATDEDEPLVRNLGGSYVMNIYGDNSGAISL